MREYSTLGSIRLDVIKTLKIRWIFEITESRHAMAQRRVRPASRRNERSRSSRTENQCGAPRQLRKLDHRRDPILAALSESHHHTVGNAGSANLGSGSGRAKRFHRAVRVRSMVNCGTTYWFHSRTRSSARVAAT